MIGTLPLAVAALALSSGSASAPVLTSAQGSGQGQFSRVGIAPPKLVVLISIDQFRGDYVERFYKYFLPAKSGNKLGGFRFLMDTGAHFRNAMHNHLPTATGPGHATLMSGSEPAIDGIVSNDWYNRATGKTMYCVEDSTVETVGGTSGPMSPKNLLVTTVGDELKIATNGRSKVVGVAIKDRASILMAGHAADDVIWWDAGTGNWVTSSFYAPSKQLPAWVAKLNAARPADALAGKTWEPVLENDAYAISHRSPFEKESSATKPFAHPMDAQVGKSLYSGMISSPFGNDVTLNAAEAAIDADKLGQHDTPDVLVINLSSNDYVGHRYGPNSPEVMDITIQTDRRLSGFLNKLQNSVPGGIDNVAIVVTGDHGVVSIPEETHDTYHTGNVRGTSSAAENAVQKALVAKFGEGKWIVGSGLYEQNLYLNRALAAEKGIKMVDVETVAAEAAITAPGIFGAYGRTQIMNNGLPNYAFKDRILNGFNTKDGGDVFILEAAGDYASGGIGTGHGSVWDYDAHVPILFRAKGIAPGAYLKRVHTSDIAPTLCRLLGIESPTGNVGVPLVDTLPSGR